MSARVSGYCKKRNMPVSIRAPINQQLSLVVSLCGWLAAIEVINIATGRMLNGYGLIPRDLHYLSGILAAPFLHGSISHFASNIVPFAVFSLLMMQYGRLAYLRLSLAIIASTGLLVWLLGRPALHIGASGVVFGYFGFLVVAGLRSQQIKHLAISIFVAVAYGSLIWGVLPGAPGISFESHLFGALSGAILGFRFGR